MAGCITRVQAGGTCKRFYRRSRPTPRVVPPPAPNDEVRYIGLTKGKFAIVDAADYDWLMQYRWYAFESNGTFYARGTKDHAILMHRLIMNPPKGMVVDHIDGNGLNNRRSNLRICTRRENSYNQGPRKTSNRTSQFKGVGRLPNGSGKCYAKITYKGETFNLGLYDTEIEAAKAYDRKALEFFGEFAWLNFPDEIRAEDPRPGHDENRCQDD